MAQALVNTTSGTSDSSATTLAATAASHTTGNGIYVAVIWSGNVNCSSVTDTAGNTYTSTGQKANNGTSDHAEIFYAENITGNAANIITAHFSAAATFRRVMVHQVSGSATSGSFTAGQGGTALATSAGSVTTSSWTTTSANAYLFAGFGSSGAVNHTNVVAGTSYTKELDNIGTDSGTEDRIVSATGTYTAGYTASSGTQTWWLAAASFVASGGGSTDTFAFATTGKATPSFALAGMTDTITLAVTGKATPSFALAGMTDTITLAATGKATPSFTLAGMSDPISFTATGGGVPSFVMAGMSDTLAFAAQGQSAPSFALGSIPPAGTLLQRTMVGHGV